MTQSADQPSEFDKLEGLTHAVVDYIQSNSFDALDDRYLKLAKRCILDGLSVAVGGSEQHGMKPLGDFIDSKSESGTVPLLGKKSRGSSASLAALWMGTAGHAMDWDDTQLAEGPGRPYGLLMHPTMPPLAASLCCAAFVAEQAGEPVNGQRLLTAFTTGFEVGCKIAEAITPDHYMKGFHTSGTIGTFAATASASKMIGLDAGQTARAIGIAASLAAGIRANFGTMTKPLHVGRAAQNGIDAALLARAGFSANDEALDGKWGYLSVAGRGGDASLVRDRIGAPPTMVSPGVSIKPYPSGVLTHPTMDALLFLMRDEKLEAKDIARITVSAGSNVLGPIRFARAMTELEGKFSFQFLLSAIALKGGAGKAEFTDVFVQSDPCQNMQGRIQTKFDQSIEDLGWDRIRSRIDLVTTDGRTLSRWADEAYRGGPQNPLSDAQIEDKFRNCAQGLLDEVSCQSLFDLVWSLEKTDDVMQIFTQLAWNNA